MNKLLMFRKQQQTKGFLEHWKSETAH